MEDSVDIAIQHIQEWAKVLIYIIIGVLALLAKSNRKRKTHTPVPQETPAAEPEPKLKPAAVIPKREVKKKAERKYFTYEDETDFRSVTEQKKAVAEQAVKAEEQGSMPDFDLRTAVIASEILKPKFED